MPERFNEQFSVYVNTALKEYEQERGIQIRYVPKIHPIFSKAITLRLEKIISEAENLREAPHVLVSQYGRPLPFSAQTASTEIVTGTETTSPTYRKGPRPGELLNFVRDEVEQFKSGGVSHLSSNEELRSRFGYSNASSLYRLLGREGLIRERKQLVMERGRERVQPSPNLAWILGILSGGGYVMPKNGAIGFTSYEKQQLEAFKTTAEGLFNKNIFILPDENEDSSYRRAVFYSTSIARALGNLGRTQWPQTLAEKHRWIFENPSYIWKFLNGFFEVRGQLSTRGIVFTTAYIHVGNMLMELLTSVGINNPRFQTKNGPEREISGVGIHNSRDQKLFSQHISSVVPSKEQKLEIYRNKKVPGNTEVDFLTEWSRLKRLLGHTPNSYDISRLKKQGQTKFHYSSYGNRFGSGSFIKASEYLERIISEGEQ